ncbi:acetyl-CoA carboxylase biotin carboxyl carrier protein subunit [Edaphobacter sp. 12200R-103]|jgi:biotin carboxyl carrier protein|uniref:acetyl-CoA carboxylase biotin carboxyl carrier protein subunit n=1 Tax=Edaphobacter sp. 12200R-103 TaxID=2703788 RepID=UPI00138CBD30|nr:acetyl-CoA carboxylase biotin carboxyl carrier protein subunit [Edaphobacter sp. 12200R-103]QHS52822.1 acetyl-CoA carboxylase biotin carboxyl carrier protein subunit [Edaphobacter sp. 12200R-103]
MTTWLRIGDERLRIELPENCAEAGRMTCSVADRTVEVDATFLGCEGLSLLVDGRQYRCALDGDAVVIAGRRYEFTIEDPRALRGRGGAGEGGSGPRAVKAPMPGRVVRVLVVEGDEVEALQGVVVIEAMKMQNELKVPRAGRISRVAITADTTVEAGQVLIVVE